MLPAILCYSLHQVRGVFRHYLSHRFSVPCSLSLSGTLMVGMLVSCPRGSLCFLILGGAIYLFIYLFILLFGLGVICLLLCQISTFSASFTPLLIPCNVFFIIWNFIKCTHFKHFYLICPMAHPSSHSRPPSVWVRVFTTNHHCTQPEPFRNKWCSQYSVPPRKLQRTVKWTPETAIPTRKSTLLPNTVQTSPTALTDSASTHLPVQHPTRHGESDTPP